MAKRKPAPEEMVACLACQVTMTAPQMPIHDATEDHQKRARAFLGEQVFTKAIAKVVPGYRPVCGGLPSMGRGFIDW